MVFLINASNLKAGGGLQVVDSICRQLYKFKQHRFVVVLSSYLATTKGRLQVYENVDVVDYTIPNSFSTIVLGRDKYLDELVQDNKIDAVLTVFGPSRWAPKRPHLCGFARAQLLLKDSPYYRHLSWKERIIHRVWNWAFKKSSRLFYTENEYISQILESKYQNVKVYTVSNYYNQVFDAPESWKKSITLPKYDGITCLSISSPTSHKNFGIIEGIIRYLRDVHPGFNVRFVLTFDETQWPLAEDVRDHVVYVGKTDVSEGPYLYEQADIMFMPTLLECFTATYPEAMRMGVPIVTTDLEFARGLCGDAACYYSAIDAKAAAEAIYKVATDKEYSRLLVENGEKQLLSYDDYEKRAEKLIDILESIAKG